MHKNLNWLKSLSVGLACLSVASLCAADWPEWRGPNRAGVWNETGIVEKLPGAGLKVLWRTPIGLGYSTPVIVGARVYLSDSELAKPNVRQRLHCFGADSGKKRWTFSYESPGPDWFFTEEMARGPGATPIVRDGKIYAVDLFGTLVCVQAQQGKLLWRRNLKLDFQMQETSMDSSPLIEGELLILLLGGKNAGVVALDRNDGREIWRALDERITWSSPIVIEAAGVRQLIVWTQQSVSSLNPATGKLYWREPTSTGGSPGTAGVSTPIFQNGYLLVSGWMLQLAPDHPGAKTLWPEGAGVTRRILSDTSTGLFLGDYIYSAKTGGDFVCLRAASGEEVWKTTQVTAAKTAASVQMTARADSTFLFNDQGELIQAHLGPSGYMEIGRAKLIEPTSPFGSQKFAWTAPAFARRNVYVRNDRELICVSLANQWYSEKRKNGR